MPTPSRDSQRGGQSWGPLLGLCVTAPANAPSHAPPFSHQPASRLAISSKPLRPSPSSPNNKDSLVKHLETSSGLKKKKKKSHFIIYILPNLRKREIRHCPRVAPLNINVCLGVWLLSIPFPIPVLAPSLPVRLTGIFACLTSSSTQA